MNEKELNEEIGKLLKEGVGSKPVSLIPYIRKLMRLEELKAIQERNAEVKEVIKKVNSKWFWRHGKDKLLQKLGLDVKEDKGVKDEK